MTATNHYFETIVTEFFLNGLNPVSFLFIFVLFSHFKDKYSTNLTINDKSPDGVLGSRTRRMESALSYSGTPLS